MTKTRIILPAVLLLLSLTAGWYGYQIYRSAAPPAFRLTGEGVERLPAFAFPDIDGITRSSAEWNGQVLVINFWATWCPPCREEMPMFIEMQKRYGSGRMQIIGIAIDEPDLVRDFNDVYGINFPTLIGGVQAIKLANTLGNRFDTLPFTAIFDRQGNSRYIQAGEVTRETLEEQLGPLL